MLTLVYLACPQSHVQGHLATAIALLLTRIKEIVVQLERREWEALKNKDAASYAGLLTDHFVNVGANGITTTAKEKNLPDQITLTDYKMEHVRVVSFKLDVVLLVYKATQKEVLRGQPVPTRTWISLLWIMPEGKWVNAFHQEAEAE
jgi:hypothetical protein